MKRIFKLKINHKSFQGDLQPFMLHFMLVSSCNIGASMSKPHLSYFWRPRVINMATVMIGQRKVFLVNCVRVGSIDVL